MFSIFPIAFLMLIFFRVLASVCEAQLRLSVEVICSKTVFFGDQLKPLGRLYLFTGKDRLLNENLKQFLRTKVFSVFLRDIFGHSHESSVRFLILNLFTQAERSVNSAMQLFPN